MFSRQVPETTASRTLPLERPDQVDDSRIDPRGVPEQLAR